MPKHRVFIPPSDDRSNTPQPGQTLDILGEEAQHAIRVKRCDVGHHVELLNGRGLLAKATITDTLKVRSTSNEQVWCLRVHVDSVTTIDPTTPRLDVCTPIPKGSRLSDMIDQLSQIGVHSWAPLLTAHAARDTEHIKHDRLERIAAEASKQSGRPWLMAIHPERTLAQTLATNPTNSPNHTIILADATGTPHTPLTTPHATLLIGPEGGWTPAELDHARRANARITRFGPHTMRLETAATAASAIILQP